MLVNVSKTFLSSPHQVSYLYVFSLWTKHLLNYLSHNLIYSLHLSLSQSALSLSQAPPQLSVPSQLCLSIALPSTLSTLSLSLNQAPPQQSLSILSISSPSLIMSPNQAPSQLCLFLNSYLFQTLPSLFLSRFLPSEFFYKTFVHHIFVVFWSVPMVFGVCIWISRMSRRRRLDLDLDLMVVVRGPCVCKGGEGHHGWVFLYFLLNFILGYFAILLIVKLDRTGPLFVLG